MQRSLVMLFAAGALAASACAAEEDDGLGQVDLSLVGQAASGVSYRLRDATLTINGPGGMRVFRTEDDPNRTTITARMPSGPYTLDLSPGWRFERLLTDGTAQPVPAELITADPLPFNILAGGFTPVQLRFRAGGDDVGLGDGDVGISVGVEEVPDGGVPSPVRFIATPPNFAFDEGTQAQFQLRLSQPPLGPQPVVATIAAPPGVQVSPPQVTFNPLNWNQPQAITVAAPRDPDVIDLTGVITIHAATLQPLSVPFLVRDTGGAPAILATASSLALDEGASGTVAVRLAAQPTSNVIVSVASPSPLLIAAPATLTFSPTTWNVIQTVNVTAVQDDDVVDNAVPLRFSTPGLPVVELSYAISDDDIQSLIVTPPTLTINEGGSQALSVRLSFRPAAPVTVALSSSDAARLALSQSTLTFTPTNFSAPQSVTANALPDPDTQNQTATIRVGIVDSMSVTIPVQLVDLSSNVAWGFPAWFGTNVQQPPGLLIATQINVGGPSIIDRLLVIGAAGDARLALYSDAGDRPGALIVGTPRFPLSTSPAPSTMPVPPITLPAGKYWIGVVVPAPTLVGQASGSPTALRCTAPMAFDAPSFPQGATVFQCPVIQPGQPLPPALNLAALGHQ